MSRAVVLNYGLPAVLGAWAGFVAAIVIFRVGRTDETPKAYLPALTGLLGATLGFASARYNDRKGDERRMRRRLRYELLRAEEIPLLIKLIDDHEERRRYSKVTPAQASVVFLRDEAGRLLGSD